MAFTCSSIRICGQSSPGPSFLPLLHPLTTLQCSPHHCFIMLLQHNRGRKKWKSFKAEESSSLNQRGWGPGDLMTVPQYKENCAVILIFPLNLQSIFNLCLCVNSIDLITIVKSIKSQQALLRGAQDSIHATFTFSSSCLCFLFSSTASLFCSSFLRCSSTFFWRSSIWRSTCSLALRSRSMIWDSRKAEHIYNICACMQGKKQKQNQSLACWHIVYEQPTAIILLLMAFKEQQG